MQETLNIKEIAGVILKKIYIILICASAGLAAGYFISAYIVHPKFTSSVSLYVYNASEGQTSSTVNLGDLNASQRLVNTYTVILQDDEVMEQVAARLMEEFDPEDLAMWISLSEGPAGLKVGGLRNSITMRSLNNTEVLNISAETKDPQLSARICTIMTEVAPEVLIRVVKAGSVEVIGSAKAAISPSSPNVRNYSIIGLVAGTALSVLAVLLMYFLDNTVKDDEGLKKRYNIPILGEVPDFTSQHKGGYYRYGS